MGHNSEGWYSVVCTILNISFVIIERDHIALSPFIGHSSCTEFFFKTNCLTNQIWISPIKTHISTSIPSIFLHLVGLSFVFYFSSRYFTDPLLTWFWFIIYSLAYYVRSLKYIPIYICCLFFCQNPFIFIFCTLHDQYPSLPFHNQYPSPRPWFPITHTSYHRLCTAEECKHFVLQSTILLKRVFMKKCSCSPSYMPVKSCITLKI